jgi:O-methyltransferase involved in polyketide biosynthesis
MACAGYRESARTLFLWEGVTNYLDEAAVDATLRWCARASPGSLLLFTYVHRDFTRPDAFAVLRRRGPPHARARVLSGGAGLRRHAFGPLMPDPLDVSIGSVG